MPLKNGRPKGRRNAAPRKGTITEKAVKAFERSPRRAGAIAKRLGTSEQLVSSALDKWVKGWRDQIED